VDGIVDYAEGVDVGHRGWDRLGRVPAAPFGHGLGWTTWEYRAAEVAHDEGGVTVAVTVTNSGRRRGREVVQVYVEPPDGTAAGERPVRWLGGFAVVDADPGATTTVPVPLHPYALRTWDTAAGWVTPPGTYPIRVGRSSRDLRLTTEVVVAAPAQPSSTGSRGVVGGPAAGRS
jgi:beta-glucosidase